MSAYLRSLSLAHITSKGFHTNLAVHNKNGRIIMKLLKGSKKRAKWHDPYTPSPSLLPTPSSFAKSGQVKKRVDVLNKLFMKNITDLMATGRCSEAILGLGIEVTRVKVGSEFNLINVYWTSQGIHPDDHIARILRQSAGDLCQELTTLNLIGRVPQIKFVRDKSNSSWTVVDSLLKIADFDDDYEPQGHNALKADFNNQGFLVDTNELPPMRQNVFGLNREDIMDRIQRNMKSKKKAKVEHHDNEMTHTPLQPFDQETFREFLLQKKIDRDRILKTEMKETETNVDEYYFEEPSSAADDEDYIEEDDEDYSR